MLQTTLTDRLLDIGHATEAGVANSKNDDAYLIFPAFYLTDIQASRPVPVHVAIVADGEGEQGAGGVASQLAVEKMYSVITESQTTPIPERISEAIERANSDIYHTAQDDSTLREMSATTVATAVLDSEAYFAHVGDCQAHVLRNGTLWRLTREQRSGRFVTEEKTDVANEDMIGSRALGEKSTVTVDQLIMAPPELTSNKAAVGVRVNRSWLPLQPLDTILLCSKGLTDVLGTDSIQKILDLYAPQEAANQLVASVIEAGGSDNVTVVVMRWNGEVKTGADGGFHFSRPIGLLIGALMALLAVVVWWVLSSSTNITPVGPVANTPEPPVLEAATPAGETDASVAIVATLTDDKVVTEALSVTATAGNASLATPTIEISSPSPESSTDLPDVARIITATVSITALESIAIVPTANVGPTNDGNLFITVEPPTAEMQALAGTPEPAEAAAVAESPTVDLTATALADIGSIRSAVAATLTALPTRTPEETDTPRPTSTATNRPTQTSSATSTETPTPRPTSTPTPTPTPLPTNTPSPTATSTPLPTDTPDLGATVTAEAERVAVSIAATLTAQPTSTPTRTATPLPTSTPSPTATSTPLPTDTPNLGATVTAEAERVAVSIAATLTAQPTATPTHTATPLPTSTPSPTATSTPLPTDTPNLGATVTAESERVAVSIAATLTAQPTATPTHTATPLPTSTPSPTATPNLAATATNESMRRATSIAATLTARPTSTATNTRQPTTTPTRDLSATVTAEARRRAMSIASTLTAQPTVTPTHSPTSTPRPSATAMPNIGATRTAEVRRLATSIAVTLTARPTMTPTRTPRPTSTPTAAVPPTPAVTATPTTYVPPSSNSVQLVSPAAGTTADSAVRFEWQASFTPDAGRGFELVLWRDGQDPLRSGFGLAAPTSSTSVLADLPALDTRLGDLLEPGDYRWGILLVQTEPYLRLQYLGEGFALRYTRSGGGGSGGGSGSGGVSSGE